VQEAHRAWKSAARGAAVALVASLVGLAAGAQTPGPLEQNAETDLQRRTAAAIETLCPKLPSFGASVDGARPLDQLYLRCSQLISTAPGGGGGMGDVPPLPGVSPDELNDLLVEVAPYEASAPGLTSTETAKVQITNVSNRLLALRQGATGISFAGLSLVVEGARLDGRLLDTFQLPWAAAVEDGDEVPRWGAFLNADGGFGSWDESAEDAGFDFHNGGLTGGVDYRLRDDLAVGLAFGWARTQQDFTGGAVGSDLRKDAYSTSLYGTWTHASGAHVDGIVTYTRNEYELERLVGFPGAFSNARGDTSANEGAGSLGLGWDVDRGAWSAGPYARVDVVYTKLHGFSEHGAGGLNLSYSDQSIWSVASILGGQVAYALSTPFGVVTPQVRAEYEHEFEDDSRHVKASFAADPTREVFFAKSPAPDRNFANLGGSISLALPHGVSAFVDYETVLGRFRLEDHQFTLGGRVEF
jgi:outer membrane lipase/esterase